MSQGVVVDTSALIEWLFAPQPWPGFNAITSESLHAPSLIDYEFVAALRKARRRPDIGLTGASTALLTFQWADIQRHEAHHLTSRMWALRDNFTAYDASYVALAEALDLPLVTADLRLARSAARTCEVFAPDR